MKFPTSPNTKRGAVWFWNGLKSKKTRRKRFQKQQVRARQSDASITEEVANDFPGLFARYPNITHVFFNTEGNIARGFAKKVGKI
jgi:hypothetical protein